jgi:hypothetical protein
MQIKTTKGLHASKLKAIVYADSGMGKTTLLGTLPEDKTLIISAESGLLCLNEQDISVVEIKSWTDLQEVYKNLTKNPEWDHFEFIALDSLTEMSDRLVSMLESSPEFRDPKMALKMWSEYSKRMTATIKAFRDLDKTVVFTALPEDVLDGGVVTKKPYIKGSAVQKMLNSYFDEVFYLCIDESTDSRHLQTQPSTSATAKDRSGKLNPYEEPNLTNIINKIKGK